MPHPSTKFHTNQASSFSLIPLTDRHQAGGGNYWSEHSMLLCDDPHQQIQREKQSRGRDVSPDWILPVWRGCPLTVLTPASQLVVDASLLFVSLFYFMNQVKELAKCSFNYGQTNRSFHRYFSSQSWRGEGTEHRKESGYTRCRHTWKSHYVFRDTTQDKVVKMGWQRKAPSSRPFTWRGPCAAAKSSVNEHTFLNHKKM